MARWRKEEKTHNWKNTCWHGLQRGQLIDTAGLSTVFFLKQVQSQGSLQGCHCLPTFVLPFNATLRNYKTWDNFSLSLSLITSYNSSNAFKTGNNTVFVFYNIFKSDQPQITTWASITSINSSNSLKDNVIRKPLEMT